jgi:formylglycine-generating enzyme required for sulfatase activity
VNKVDDAWTKQQKDGVPVSRGPDDPVVGVSWEHAQAFCQWLTEKESAEGKLAKGAKYRLPTDEEWSGAVGLGAEQGATPAEKSGKDNVHYPWGLVFPPPKAKMGNYADAAWHEKFPKERWIEGYTDGYATTSPVGSFPANAYGLYDMGGNVWQWCEDWFDASQKDRVVRGGSWTYDPRSVLLSSNRFHGTPGARSPAYGFRCVLAPSSSAPSTAAAPAQALSSDPATATTNAVPIVDSAGVPFHNTAALTCNRAAPWQAIEGLWNRVVCTGGTSSLREEIRYPSTE